MRLLSQDGTTNVPFDQAIVRVEYDGENEHRICVRMIGDLKWIVMAQYEKDYQATFAIKMMNLKYNTDGITTYHFPSEQEIQRMMGKV